MYVTNQCFDESHFVNPVATYLAAVNYLISYSPYYSINGDKATLGTISLIDLSQSLWLIVKPINNPIAGSVHKNICLYKYTYIHTHIYI